MRKAIVVIVLAIGIVVYFNCFFGMRNWNIKPVDNISVGINIDVDGHTLQPYSICSQDGSESCLVFLDPKEIKEAGQGRKTITMRGRSLEHVMGQLKYALRVDIEDQQTNQEPDDSPAAKGEFI
ncbi:MAG: hypothetical protein US49_C0018G0007 [candidate division TM6 bacterium GW2011_GWF2_37_49]|nr:MAG: hypothetical protein US49_C0018G0007 [candidate division TM6 bacterium GW2011_GWF2_37_49]